ncbi:MAG: DNA primase [Isosphaerales bacterium]
MPRHTETTTSAIKNAIDIVALVGEYLSLRRAGSKYKALCPWHDDHNPSLEVNPERQSFKCWSCGVGGDIFDFVKNYEHVDFPEALRMLADRAGVALESPSAFASPPGGPSKSDLFEVNAWAEEVFARALQSSAEVLGYVEGRGITRQSVLRFRLGYAPADRGWMLAEARRRRFTMEMLEQAGLASHSADSPGLVRERFRGRLIFPIHDDRGRTIGFGGRILPEIENKLAAEGKHVAKYLNGPETSLFHKRSILYAADLARVASREAGWVAVVEGYTDVIVAHQLGLCNVVGTMGTALGEDHLRALQRLANRVVLVFDGDEAGRSAADRALELMRSGAMSFSTSRPEQSAADRALELFLGSELDLRLLTLPANLDPCDFLLKVGADAFRGLVERAADPLAYLLTRAAARFDLDSAEGSRRAAEWVLGIMSRVPETHHLGLEVKQAKVLDTLSHRLRVPLETLSGMLRKMRRSVSQPRPAGGLVPGKAVRPAGDTPSSVGSSGAPADPAPIRQSELDRTDLELIQIVLSEPAAITWLIPRLAVSALRDAPLRTMLQACYDLQDEGQSPSYENLMVRLDDPAVRALAASLIAQSALSTPDPGHFPEDLRPAPWRERLERMLIVLDKRERQARLRDLKRSLDETDQHADPDAHRAIQLEYQRLLTSGQIRKS